MLLKVYVPTTVEIPSEYLVPLAQRAFESLGDSAKRTPATRGHLVRQAINDGLLRDLDSLVGENGKIDLFCDPSGELPLEIDDHTFNLSELLEALQGQKLSASAQPDRREGLPSAGDTRQRKAA